MENVHLIVPLLGLYDQAQTAFELTMWLVARRLALALWQDAMA